MLDMCPMEECPGYDEVVYFLKVLRVAYEETYTAGLEQCSSCLIFSTMNTSKSNIRRDICHSRK